ncbi:MAG: hypothetical protein FJ137_20230 [Deltaproteobacteria bacterium]|nr:hypothetical protein [Deltaproteobacteria bacterium]
MAKKHKKPTEPTAAAETSPATTAAAAPSASTESTAPAVGRVEQAFALGNYSFVRRAAADATTPAAQTTAAALLPRVVVEPAQVGVGLVGLVVILTACALTLTGGG